MRRPVLLAYLLPSVLSAVAVQSWFRPGTAIAGGDLIPPVAPQPDYLAHWSYLANGEGAPGYAIVGLPYAAWLDAWAWLGADGEVAQRLWLSMLFAASAAAVVFLGFGFTASALAAGSAGLLASFNAYRLVLGPDPVPMAAIVVAALLGGFIARAALREGRKASVVGFAVASVGLGYVMTNPPHVVLVMLWVFACAAIAVVAQPVAARSVIGLLAKAIPIALLLNAWWIVPAWLTLLGSGFTERFGAAGVEDWAWTHERSTLANALTLNTTWGWRHPEYFPYAERLSEWPFAFLRVFFPVLAVAGVVMARRGERRTALGLALVALVGVWLTTGLRGPLPGINRSLYDHLPGYWLFRDPAKILLLVVLPAALLGGIAVKRLVYARRLPLMLVAIGLTCGALLYVYPLYTGEVIPDKRPLLPSAHVRMPEAWYEAAATLNARRDMGKVLVLPRSDFYQTPTTWGYYGASFSREMVQRPVLEAQAGGYLRVSGAVASLEESIERDLLGGRTAEVNRKLAALGVGYVLLRRDVDATFPNRRTVEPDMLARSLRRVPGVRKLRSFGILDVYRAGDIAGNEVFAAMPTFYAGLAGEVASATSVVRGAPAFITETADQRSVTGAGIPPKHVVMFEERKVRLLAIRAQGEKLRLRLVSPDRVAVDGKDLPTVSEAIATLTSRERPILVTAGSAVFRLPRMPRAWTNLGVVELGKGGSVGLWRYSGTLSVQPESGGPVGDCNAVDDRRPEEVGIRATITRPTGSPTLRLAARAHSACVDFPLIRGRLRDTYAVRFRYRQLQGRPPRACLWQQGVDDCTPAPALQPGRRWKSFEAVVGPGNGATSVSLFLYADGQEQGPVTVTEYQKIKVERYRRVVPGFDDMDRPLTVTQKLFPQSVHTFTRPPLSKSVDLTKAGPVGDCNRRDDKTAAELRLAAVVLNQADSPVLRLAASDHSACVAFSLTPITPATRAYRIRFDYRSVQGSSPRACVWQVGPDRCTSVLRLRSGRGWHTFDETVRLDPNVSALDLFFYADGGASERTVTEYRRVYAEPASPLAILGFPPKRPLPRIVARREAPWKLRVRVQDARAPFILATSDAYAAGWKARADGRGSSGLRHIHVNGYANGWVVPLRGSYELTLEYQPERYARVARWLSAVTLMAVLLWAAERRVKWLPSGRADSVLRGWRSSVRPDPFRRQPRSGRTADRRLARRRRQ